VLSLDGYDPLVETKPEVLSALQRLYTAPVEAARAYGIHWIVVDRVIEKPLPNVLAHEQMVLHRPIAPILFQASRQSLQLPEVAILELPGSSPLAFCQSEPNRALPIELGGAGPTVDVSSRTEGGVVIVNFIAWPDMAASADGVTIAADADPWGRIRTVVPAGTKQLAVRYRPPWGRGILYGAVIAVAAMVTAAGVQQSTKRWLLQRTDQQPPAPSLQATGAMSAGSAPAVAADEKSASR
jgi:hypothetical protein